MIDELYTIPSDICDILNSHHVTYFLKEQGLSFRVSRDVWSTVMVIQDVSKAQVRGAICPRFRFEFKNTAFQDDIGMNAFASFFREHNQNPLAIFTAFLSLPWGLNAWGSYETQEIPGAAVTRSDAASMRVYSPFASVAPLKAEPAKWTVAHVVRALWNNQFADLRCDGKYTDDYAFDAADDFGKGSIKHGRAFAKKLMESPDGWRSYANDGGVRINCHSFDYNSFRFILVHHASQIAA